MGKILKTEENRLGTAQSHSGYSSNQDAIIASLQIGINNIVIESDSQVAINSTVDQAQAPRSNRRY